MVRTCFLKLHEVEAGALESLYQELEREALQAMGDIEQDKIVFMRSADMRYVGQEHTVTINVSQDLDTREKLQVIKKDFDTAHEIRYNHSAPHENAEIVSVRVAAMGIIDKPEMKTLPKGSAAPPAEAVRDKRQVIFEDPKQPIECPIYYRDELLAGNIIQGPAVIEEDTCTILLPPGSEMEVGEFGQLIIEVNAQ